MIDAWFSSSEITASSAVSSTSNSPVLASKQEPNRIASSVPRNAAIRPSSRRWISCVPQMNRTDARPKPHSSRAACAASAIAESPARPR